jgi:broad specificity phosphatase PhoE
MTTSIYLARHGQTAWNKEEIFRGRTDVPLDETGLRQAELAGEYFKGMEIHAIYSSPLSRALETAQKIAQSHNIKVQPLQGILDMSFGRWEGQSHLDIQKNDREIYRQ